MASKNIYKTKLSSNSVTALERLGTVRREWSSTDSCFKTYKYVQAASDTTVANGTALAYSDTLGVVATSDVSDASANQPLGVGIGTITAGYYGWVQIGGYHSAVLSNDVVVDGASLHLLASFDGVVGQTVAGTASTMKVMGIAVGATSSGTVAALLCCGNNIIQ